MKRRASDRPAILVVDDSVDNRNMLVEYLRFCGFEVRAAATGAQGLARAQTLHPRVILMDVAMPGIDGLEATRRLKADRRTSDIMIIAVTARALTHEREAARLAGCDAFMAKPIDLQKLAAVLSAHIGGDRRSPRSTGPRPTSGRPRGRRRL